MKIHRVVATSAVMLVGTSLLNHSVAFAQPAREVVAAARPENAVVAEADPYAWLEEPIGQDRRVDDWVNGQNRRARDYLDAVPGRTAIARRVHELLSIERISVPVVARGRQFFYKQEKGAQQASFWVREGERGKARKLIDPAAPGTAGTRAIAGVVVEHSGRYVAYAIQESGSDWRVWHVVDVETGRDLPDEIRWNKFSDVSWDVDGNGFVYTRFAEPAAAKSLSEGNRDEQLYHHRLGDPQSADTFLYADKTQPDALFMGEQTVDGRYLIVNAGYRGGGVNFLVKRNGENGDFRKLFPDEIEGNAGNRLIGSDGDILYLLSTVGAPNGRIVAMDLGQEHPVPRTVVAEADFPLASATYAGGHFFASYLEDGRSSVRVFDGSGRPSGAVALPEFGSAVGFAGDAASTSVYFEFSSFSRPTSIFRYDIARGRTVAVSSPKAAVDPAAYSVREVFFTARDGKRIPMFIAGRGNIDPTGDRPVLLYGYGGFNLSFPPDFRAERVTWMDMGGLFAFPVLPGGGEYGENWHEAGMKANKPAVFDAFADAARYLVARGYTKPERLAVYGHSNGGLLVGAVMTRNPELFAVALPTVGVLDMLRFPKFTNGRLWDVEYGSPDDPRMYPVLRGYSPYHNIVPGRHYPATLIGTGDHDDRVYPAHSLKFAARLEADGVSDGPILLSVATNAGHGAGTARRQVVEEAADHLAFTLANLHFQLPPDFPADDGKFAETRP